MGLIDTAEATKISGFEDMSPREALAALLVAGARADGSVSPLEANRIEHGLASMALFRGCSHDALQSMFGAVVERIKAHGSDTVARAAALAIPTELRGTAFAMAIDLLLADGRTRVKEERFAKELQMMLGIDSDTAAQVVGVLALKNAG